MCPSLPYRKVLVSKLLGKWCFPDFKNSMRFQDFNVLPMKSTFKLNINFMRFKILVKISSGFQSIWKISMRF